MFFGLEKVGLCKHTLFILTVSVHAPAAHQDVAVPVRLDVLLLAPSGPCHRGHRGTGAPAPLLVTMMAYSDFCITC